MSAPLRVVVLGAAGRMGRSILEQAGRAASVQVHGAVVRPGHLSLGRAALPGLVEVALVSDPGQALVGADVMIDFTRPELTMSALAQAAEAGVAAVVGTTGLSQAQQEELEGFAARIPVVFSANMSVGVNVMLGLLRVATEALGQEYDLEVFELHHKHKVDAPSGTALRLAQVLCQARGVERSEALRHHREGVSPRQEGEIGMQVLRGGDVAGEHTVYFLGDGERLEITHRASSREVFAKGALRAARWVHGKKPGLYGMEDVLGL